MSRAEGDRRAEVQPDKMGGATGSSMYCVKVEIEKPSLKRDLNENTNSADVFGRALQRFSARFYKFGHTNFIKFV